MTELPGRLTQERYDNLIRDVGSQEEADRLLGLSIEQRLRIAQYLADSASSDSGSKFTVALVSG